MRFFAFSTSRWMARILVEGVGIGLLGGMVLSSVPPMRLESAVTADHAVATETATPDLTELGWIWPVERFRIAAPFVAPAHRYGPGHRGVDLDPDDSAPGGFVVRAPADGVIAFSGPVAGRGILTIDHGDGLVTTLEPVVSEFLPGTIVTRGQVVGEISVGGHAKPGFVHFGVRLNGEYINPMLLLGAVERAILLPCC